MAGDKLLKGFLDLMEEKKWILRLKAGADGVHRLRGVESTPEIAMDSKAKKEGKLAKGILNGRPFLREAIEVSTLIFREVNRALMDQDEQ